MKKKLIAVIMLTTMSVPFVACSNKTANEVESKEGITIEEKDSKNSENIESSNNGEISNNDAVKNIEDKSKVNNPSVVAGNEKQEQVDISNNNIANQEEEFCLEKPSNNNNNWWSDSDNINKPNNKPNNKPVIPPTSGVVDSSYLSEVENVIFNATNAERTKAGLPALKRNSTANQYARSKSKDMLENNYFDHYSPSQGMISDIAKRDGWRYSRIGENIYTSTGMNPDGQAITTSWMNSQGHRENILNTGFAEIGIGVTYSNGKLHATQIFYTP